MAGAQQIFACLCVTLVWGCEITSAATCNARYLNRRQRTPARGYSSAGFRRSGFNSPFDDAPDVPEPKFTSIRDGPPDLLNRKSNDVNDNDANESSSSTLSTGSSSADEGGFDNNINDSNFSSKSGESPAKEDDPLDNNFEDTLDDDLMDDNFSPESGASLAKEDEPFDNTIEDTLDDDFMDDNLQSTDSSSAEEGGFDNNNSDPNFSPKSEERLAKEDEPLDSNVENTLEDDFIDDNLSPESEESLAKEDEPFDNNVENTLEDNFIDDNFSAETEESLAKEDEPFDNNFEDTLDDDVMDDSQMQEKPMDDNQMDESQMDDNPVDDNLMDDKSISREELSDEMYLVDYEPINFKGDFNETAEDEANTNSTSKKVIVDVDGGIEDFQALVFLLAAHAKQEIDILAITCTAGHTTIRHCLTNVLRLLETAGLLNIPVYAGISEHLVEHVSREEPHIFGSDGFGDLQWQKGAYVTLTRDTPAALAMAAIADAHPGEVSVLALAPLTNVALAMKLEPTFALNLRDMFMFGGNYRTSLADFSTTYDPEAAHIVFDKMVQPVTVLPWETCQSADFRIFWYEDHAEPSLQNPVYSMLVKAEKSVYKGKNMEERWYSCDPEAVLAYLHPEEFIIESVDNGRMHVELADVHTRGRIVYDAQLDPPHRAAIKWITGVDREFYMRKFIEAFSDICSYDVCSDVY